MADHDPLGHRGHDRLLVAAAIGRRGPLDRARALLAACTECAGLYADLQALALALPQTATPPRPRDFTLTEADAARLRPRGLRRWLGLIGSSRDTISRPLALGFTTLGLAGLLVATVPGALPGSAGGAAASAAPEVELAAPARSEAMGFEQHAPATERVSPAADRGGRTTADMPIPPEIDPGLPPVVLLSAGFLAVGGGLFVARHAATRRRLR